MTRWFLLLLLLIWIPVSADETAPVVRNPETPREGVVDVKPGLLWQRGDDTDEIFFGVVPRVVCDETSGELFVLDSQLHEIQVFDREGEWLRSIGREGEGPGEFRNPGDMYRAPDGQIGVMQIFPGRIVQLTPQGEPGTAFDPRQTEGFQVFYLSQGADDRIVISGALFGRDAEGGTQTEYLKSFAPDGTELASYHTETVKMQFGGMTFREPRFNSFTRRWAVAADGRVAVAPSFDDYTIHVHGPDGTLVRVIERPGFSPVERTDAEKARFQTLYDRITAWNQGSTFEVSATHQTIASLAFRPDGTLWVMSGADRWRSEDGVMAVWDVYDTDGNYVRRVRMLGEGNPAEDGYFFSADRVYQVTDLFSASMSAMGGEDGDVEVEPDPVRLVAWKFDGARSSR